MKTTKTEMTKDAIIITIESPEVDGVCKIELPVALVSPQISFQIAGMLAADPMIPRRREKTE